MVDVSPCTAIKPGKYTFPVFFEIIKKHQLFEFAASTLLFQKNTGVQQSNSKGLHHPTSNSYLVQTTACANMFQPG
jgi:hypothetical protein